MSLSDFAYLCPQDGEYLERPDPEAKVFVCPRCATEYSPPFAEKFLRLTESRQLTSPGMVNNNLGTDQKQTIRELHREGLLLSIQNLWNGRSDEGFWITLTQKLKDRGLSEEKIALVSAVVRRQVKYINKKRSDELNNFLKQILGENA